MIPLIVDPPNQDLVSDTIAAEAYKRANPLIPMQGRIQQGRNRSDLLHRRVLPATTTLCTDHHSSQ
jgi:hypothetical protein